VITGGSFKNPVSVLWNKDAYWVFMFVAHIRTSTLQMRGRWESNNKCLVPIYVFTEMKLCSLLISKTEL